MEEFVVVYKKDPFIWTFLIGSLILLAYAAQKIKAEKDLYLNTAVKFKLKNLRFKIPSWWTLVEKSETLLRFERTDTHYDWYSQFEIVDSADNLHGLAKSVFQKRKIDLDPSYDVSEVFQGKKPSLRFEGMGTQDGNDRVYYDLYLKQISKTSVLIAESRSSILNGCVEGPYFEEVINRMKIKKKLKKEKTSNHALEKSSSLG